MAFELSLRAVDEMLTIALHWGVLIIGAIGFIVVRRGVFRTRWFIAALLIYGFYDFFLTRLFGYAPNSLGQDWNWTGKLFAIGFVLTVAALPVFGWEKVGLTLKHRRGSWLAYGVLAVLSGAIFYLAATTGDGSPDNLETIAFQWTMPGFDEELFYRGLLLLALNEAFRGEANILGAPIGWGGVLTCVLFGAIHTLGWNGGLDAPQIEFDPNVFAMTGGPAAILLWLRARTGSLLAPVIGHNVANGAFTLF